MNYGRLKTCNHFSYSQPAFVFPHHSLQNWQQERSGRSHLASPKCHSILSKRENIIIFSQVAISKNTPHQFCLAFNICSVAEAKALQQQGQVTLIRLKLTQNAKGFCVSRNIQNSEVWRKYNFKIFFVKICIVKTCICLGCSFCILGNLAQLMDNK